MSLLALVFVACGDDDEDTQPASTPEASTTTLAMSSPAGKEPSPETIKFDQDSYTAPAGKVVIDFTNKSEAIPHAVVVERNGEDIAQTDQVTGASSKSREFDLQEGETLTLYCPVGEHRDNGMEVELTAE